LTIPQSMQVSKEQLSWHEIHCQQNNPGHNEKLLHTHMKENINYYGFNWPKHHRKPRILNNYARLSIAFIFILALSFLLLFYSAKGQTLPAGFSRIQVATGLNNPTILTFSPDGRIFIAEQDGDLFIVKNGALLSTPFVSLPVNSSGERGLLGIAFDPNFTSNQYVYLYYTVSNGTHNRISRFTANGDVAIAGSEVIIKELDPLSTATNHNGGTMQFGPDGKLYVGIGENANSANAQNLDTYHGKILRLNSDGSIPAGNPFATGTAQRMSVWAYGVRNPYTLTFQPGTGRLFVNDVGETTWEEINDATSGGLNFGWPAAEGFSSNSAYTNPVYAYGHGTGSGLGCAITGGTFFNPTATNYPSLYSGNYFYIDYCGEWMDRLTISGSTVTRTNFASNIGGYPVGLVTGTDGNLYFLSRGDGALYKISYSGTAAPVITTQPQNQTVSQGSNVTFSVSATGSSLTYQWYKDGNSITGANASSYTINAVQQTDAGLYAVTVSNSAGTVTSNNAALTVTSVNQLPKGTIVSPNNNYTYAGGDVISYIGSATDAEDGTLPASAFQWYVIFHHNTHTHPGPTATSGVTSGSFTIPNSGETSVNVWYRLYLVVTDSQGAKDTSYIDILPRTTLITINTVPQGLQITLDGQPGTAPYIFASVEGMVRNIGVVSPQTYNSQVYTFSSWSQGGNQDQIITTPVNDVTYTATLSTAPATVLNAVEDAYVRGGAFSNNNYGSNITLVTKKAFSADSKYFSYIKFDISSIPVTATSVIFRIYGSMSNTSYPSGNIQLFNVVQSWSESTITFSNRPGGQSTVIDEITVSGTTPQYYEFDVTTHVVTLRNNGVTTVSFLMKNSTSIPNSRIVFNSSENSANTPQLAFITGAANVIQSRIFTEHNVTDFKMSVFPNPVNDIVTVKFSEEIQVGELTVFDSNGRMVKTARLHNNSELSVDMSDIDPGNYFLFCNSPQRQLISNIIVAR
jgi:glucose/arabinose dehydrogenase